MAFGIIRVNTIENMKKEGKNWIVECRLVPYGFETHKVGNWRGSRLFARRLMKDIGQYEKIKSVFPSVEYGWGNAAIPYTPNGVVENAEEFQKKCAIAYAERYPDKKMVWNTLRQRTAGKIIFQALASVQILGCLLWFADGAADFLPQTARTLCWGTVAAVVAYEIGVLATIIMRENKVEKFLNDINNNANEYTMKKQEADANV